MLEHHFAGVLVVNVTWRGKTYVGTLLDCTRHTNQWSAPRFVIIIIIMIIIIIIIIIRSVPEAASARLSVTPVASVGRRMSSLT